MKLVIKREPFLKAFSRAVIAAAERGPKEILTNVLLTVNNGESSLAATNLEFATRVGLGSAEMDIDEGGAVLLPAAIFNSILRESSDESLLLKLDAKRNLTISGQRTQHRLCTSAPDEFPCIDNSEEAEPLTLPAPLLAYAIKAIEPMTGEETRYALGCVLFAVERQSVTFVGTEGHAMGALEHKCNPAKESESLLPSKAAKALGRLMSDQSGDVTVWVLRNWLRFQVGDVLFMARLGEGRFPRWRDVFPAGYQTAVCIPAGQLKAAIRQATLTNQFKDARDAKFAFSAGRLTVSAHSEIGESSAEIPVAYDGPNFEIHLDWKYVTICLAAFSDDTEVALKFGSPEQPAIITHGDVCFVIMPLSSER